MARKTNDSLRKKSLVEIESYAKQNPSEGGRLAGLCGDTAALCIKEAFKYQVDRVTRGVKATDPKLQPEN